MSLNYAKMNAWDAVSGTQAECIMTIGDKRYNFMQLINFEAKIEKTKIEVPILGKPGKGSKAVSWNGTFSGTAHYNQSIFRRMLDDYKKSSVDVYFEIQVKNEDNLSKAGSQIVVLKGCNINGGILTKFDASADYLSESIDGTFDDFELVKPGFKDLVGMSV